MRRPWNIIDHPVYSLATYENDRVNMNICTYVTAVSMKPKMYAIAIDYKSKTFDNLQRSETAVLQLLNIQNMHLINLLGKKSGRGLNKNEKLQNRKLLTTWNHYVVLKEANAYLLLRKTRNENINGDHEIFYFTCERFKTNSERDILMFNDLIENRLIL